MEGFHRIDTHGWRGWARTDRTDLPADPASLLAAPGAEVFKDKPGRRVTRVELAGGLAFVKHLRGSSHIATRTLRISKRLEEAGFEAPPVLLAARRIGGEGPEEIIVTADTGIPTLYRMLNTLRDPERHRQLFTWAGRGLAELHRARFVHGDFLPGNVMVRPGDGRIVLLDNDRTRRWPVVPSAYYRDRNLIQFVYRGLLQRPWGEVVAFLTGYFEAFGVSRVEERRERLRVLRRVRQRLEPWRGQSARRCEIPPEHRPFGGIR